MLNIITFACFATFALAMEIVQAVRDHIAAKDEKERTEKAIRVSEAKKEAAEAEERAAMEKASLATLIAGMSEEQVAALSRVLDEPRKEYVPVYLPAYHTFPLCDPLAVCSLQIMMTQF